MTEPDAPPPPESLTAWHPMLVMVLESFLPSGWQLIPELLLSRLPQRVDMVILELVGSAPGVAHKLLSIFDYLRPHTLIEHKGPTDDLAAEDALVLLAYGAQYMRLKKLKDPADLCLMVIADRIPPTFVDQVARLKGSFTQVGKGLWQGELAGAVLHGVETGRPLRGARVSSCSTHFLGLSWKIHAEACRWMRTRGGCTLFCGIRSSSFARYAEPRR